MRHVLEFPADRAVVRPQPGGLAPRSAGRLHEGLNHPLHLLLAPLPALVHGHHALVLLAAGVERLEGVKRGFVALAGLLAARDHVQAGVPRRTHRVLVVVRLPRRQKLGIAEGPVLHGGLRATHPDVTDARPSFLLPVCRRGAQRSRA